MVGIFFLSFEIHNSFKKITMALWKVGVGSYE